MKAGCLPQAPGWQRKQSKTSERLSFHPDLSKGGGACEEPQPFSLPPGSAPRAMFSSGGGADREGPRQPNLTPCALRAGPSFTQAGGRPPCTGDQGWAPLPPAAWVEQKAPPGALRGHHSRAQTPMPVCSRPLPSSSHPPTDKRQDEEFPEGPSGPHSRAEIKPHVSSPNVYSLSFGTIPAR